MNLATAFQKTSNVFVRSVAAKPYPHHVISRLTALGDAGETGGEVVLFEWDVQTKLGGNKPDGHQGGAIHFGAGGNPYVAAGRP